MALSNARIAQALEEIADLLEIEGGSAFRVRAYRNAAEWIRSTSRSLAAQVAEGADLTRLPGIGRSIAAKIVELVETGGLEYLRRLERETPPQLTELLRLPGLGPKRVHRLHEELGVTTLQQLVDAAEAGRVRELEGFGAKTEQRILAAARRQAGQERRTPWPEAEELAAGLVEHLRALAGVRRVEIAGSLRRRRDTVGDLDLLACSSRGKDVIAGFCEHEDVERVVSRGSKRASVVLHGGMQVDLRVVAAESWGAALLYFTGSKAHNVALRKLSVGRGLKLNEYGLFRGRRRLAGRSEAEVYKALHLRYVEPELREDRGEIEAARKGRLPALVTLEDVRGDLHVHSNASDGRDSLEAIARAAKARGYAWVAITDHTQAARIAGGLDARRMRRHLDRIERLNERLRGITLLKSAEVEILADGSLDLPDDVLAQMDLTVCAVHFPHGLDARRQAERILRAMDHPAFTILAHPTGRLLGQREPYPLDLERVLAGAAERGRWIELNAQPRRADLPEEWGRAAKEAGLLVALGSDAHAVDQLDLMRFGVGLARRRWLEAGDVVNTRPLRELRRLLRGR